MQPRDASTHMYLAQWLIVTGYTKQGIEELDRALAIDPMLPNAVNWRGYQYLFAGDIDNAQALFERTDALGLSLAKSGLGEIALAHGNLPEARRLMAMGSKVNPSVCGSTAPDKFDTLLAGTIAGDASAQARSLQIIDDCLDTKPAEVPAWIVLSLMRLKQYARAIEIFSGRTTQDDAGIAFRVWSPEGAAIRQLPQFPEAARKIGWVAAWEKYGPPDTCSRLAPGQYRCH